MIHGSVFLNDSRTLVTGDNAGRVVVWDIEHGNIISSWQAHPSGIRAVALAPDGRTLATGGYEKAVTLWHTATWRSMLTINNPAEVMALAFSHDGQILAIGGGAGELGGGAADGNFCITRLWRAPSLEETNQQRTRAQPGRKPQ